GGITGASAGVCSRTHRSTACMRHRLTLRARGVNPSGRTCADRPRGAHSRSRIAKEAPVTQKTPPRGIDPELLSILACPETHQGLAEASAAELQKINTGIAAGGVKNVGGKAVTSPLEAG